MYQTQVLSGDYFKIFSGVYNDFRESAKKDYKFEIPPLEYKDFIDYFEKGLLKCIMLLEDGIPTGFLAYSTTPMDAVELYIIHFLGNEDLSKKYCNLLDVFIQTIATERVQKLVSYPMLGKQSAYKKEAQSFGFEFVELAVMVFDTLDRQKIKDFYQIKVPNLPIGYKITSYRDIYYQELVNTIHTAFKEASDLKFDPRFASLSGVEEIVNKLTTSVYGKFLPLSSKLLLHDNKIIGFAMSNITDGTIGNIPLVGILPEHRGQGLSKILLRALLDELLKANKNGVVSLSEVNASVDINNTSAYNMYKTLLMEEAYTYPQAYLPRLQRQDY